MLRQNLKLQVLIFFLIHALGLSIARGEDNIFPAGSDEKKPAAKVNLSADEKTLLSAAKEGELAELKKMNLEKININVVDEMGETALLKASAKGHQKVVEFLLQKNAKPEIEDAAHNTALLYAVSSNHLGVVKSLVQYGAALDAQDVSTHETVLFEAAKNGHVEMAKLLLSLGANRNHRNAKGQTAAQVATTQGFKETAKALGSK